MLCIAHIILYINNVLRIGMQTLISTAMLLVTNNKRKIKISFF